MDRVSLNVPVMWIPSWLWTCLEPAVAVTSSTVWPAGASVGGVAVTVIEVGCTRLHDRARGLGLRQLRRRSSSRPVPVVAAETVWSCAEPFVRVRLKLKSVSFAPVRIGFAVSSVMSPATSALTLTVIGRVTVVGAELRRDDHPAFGRRRVAGDLHVEASRGRLSALHAIPETTKPPPWRVAVQPVGAPDTDRLAVPSRGAVIVRSKLALDPGATAMAGYGVVTSKATGGGDARHQPDRDKTPRRQGRSRGGAHARSGTSARDPSSHSVASDCRSLTRAWPFGRNFGSIRRRLIFRNRHARRAWRAAR